MYVCHVFVNYKNEGMKTIKILTMVIAVAFATIATAVEKPKMSVIPLKADKAIVSLSNDKPANFEITINNDAGGTVYYKESKSKLTNYKKIYDFSALNDGNYELSLKVNDTKVKRGFEIRHGNITVGEAKVSYDPYMVIKDGILKVSFLNFETERIKLNIYQDGNLVYNSELGNEFVINAGFDLSKLKTGDYNVVIASNEELCSYTYVK